jgi:hypothetical protein
MPARSLAVRIIRTVLIVPGPLLLFLLVGTLFPSLPDVIGRTVGMVCGLWLISSVLLVPALLFSGSESPSDPDDTDGGGGGGSGGPPSQPRAPRGGIPLPDAEQSRERLRDHVRSDRARSRPREREPERAPAPRLPDA